MNDLATAAELRALYPAPFDRGQREARGCRGDHRRSRQALDLAPSPLDAALGPLSKACGAVVDQVRLVKGNKKAAKKLAERVIEAARTIAELLGCIEQQAIPEPP